MRRMPWVIRARLDDACSNLDRFLDPEDESCGVSAEARREARSYLLAHVRANLAVLQEFAEGRISARDLERRLYR